MRKLIITSIVICLTSFFALGQSNMSLYNFNAIPQSLSVNPATPQQTKVWVGLPAISGFHFHFHNSGFALIDLIETGTDVNENLRTVVDNLGPSSHLAIREDVELLGIGFKTRKGFVSFGANQTVDFLMDYPADLMRFAVRGNPNGDPFQGDQLNFSEFDFESTARINYYIGYQHRFLNDKLTVGTRLKYIFGLGNSYAERFNARLTALNPDSLNSKIQTDILIRSGGVTSSAFDQFSDDIGGALFSQNTGFAVDFGFNYRINKWWEVSASMIDIGSITWKENTRDFVSEGTYNYTGIGFDFSESDNSNATENFTDSLESALGFQEIDGQSYTRSLASHIYAGGTFHLSKRHSIGALYHARRWNGQTFHDYGFNYQGRLSKWFQIIGSYSVINDTYTNIGGGFDMKLGPLQLYVLSDNIYGALMYGEAQTANLRVGLNVAIYGKTDKRQAKRNKLSDERKKAEKRKRKAKKKMEKRLEKASS